MCLFTVSLHKATNSPHATLSVSGEKCSCCDIQLQRVPQHVTPFFSPHLRQDQHVQYEVYTCDAKKEGVENSGTQQAQRFSGKLWIHNSWSGRKVQAKFPK